MTQEGIPILFQLSSKSPTHSFYLAPRLAGGGGQINQALGLLVNVQLADKKIFRLFVLLGHDLKAGLRVKLQAGLSNPPLEALRDLEPQ